jgi:hypothetical protein
MCTRSIARGGGSEDEAARGGAGVALGGADAGDVAAL